jgi:hypothetical protein
MGRPLGGRASVGRGSPWSSPGQNGVILSRRGDSSSVHASGVDAHRDSMTSRLGVKGVAARGRVCNEHSCRLLVPPNHE